MMDKSFIQEIVANGGTQQFKAVDPFSKTVEDIALFSKAVHRVPLPEEPVCSALKVNSLYGILDYIASPPVDGSEPCVIHIESHESVKLMSPIQGHRRYREVYVHAVSENVLAKFAFGSYYKSGDFVPLLQSLFADGNPAEQNDKGLMLRLFSTVTSEAVRSDSDDGMTQIISVRKGISLKEDVRVPNPVLLTPWRTFRDIDQPRSAFTLRLKGADPEEEPQCALFESDGGTWKLAAINGIRKFFSDGLTSRNINDILILG